MANVYGVSTAILQFYEYISSGLITPETLTVNISSPAVALSSITYTNGTGQLQVDTIYGQALTLSGATTTLNLQSVTDLDGATVTFARIREFFLLNVTSTAGYDVKAYQGASNGWAPLPSGSSDASWARCNGGWVWLHDPNSTGGGNGNVVTGSSKNVVLDPAQTRSTSTC